MRLDHFRRRKAVSRMSGLILLLSLMISACSTQNDLKVGDKAPDFSIPEANGQVVTLSEINNDQPVLLFFHMAGG